MMLSPFLFPVHFQKKKMTFLGNQVEVNICGVSRPVLYHPNLAAHQRDDISSTKDHLKRFEEQKARLERERQRLADQATSEFNRLCTFKPEINEQV